MGFLAFLLIGGTSGVASWVFYPRRLEHSRGAKSSNLKGLLMAALLGFLAAAMSSYLGQYNAIFQSGQMLEWFSAIFASFAISFGYVAWAKAG